MVKGEFLNERSQNDGVNKGWKHNRLTEDTTQSWQSLTQLRISTEAYYEH